jgi:hypothetical protein
MPERDYSKVCRHHIPHAAECEAGVNYHDLQESRYLKPLQRVAICMGRAEGCASYEAYTAAELAQQEAEAARQNENVNKARTAIMAKVRGKSDVHGTINCPVCHLNNLTYSVIVSQRKTSVVGKCMTEGCVDFRDN